MAKYDVTYRCGHEGVVELYGPNRDRERRIEWLRRGQDCPTCYAAQRAAEAAALAETAREAGLPALTGSPKQIAWAESIRHEFLTELHAEYARFLAAGQSDARNAAFGAVVRYIEGKTSAAWWIDSKTTPYSVLLRRAFEATGTTLPMPR